MDLRRTANEREIPHLEDEHVGRGIHQSQRAVEVDWRLGEVGFEALTRHKLKDVPSGDEFLARAHHRFEFLLRGVALGINFADGGKPVERRHMQRTVECGDCGIDSCSRIVISGFGRIKFVDESVGDDLQSAQAVVENQQRVGQHKDRIGNAKRVGRRIAKGRLKLPHRIIGKIADHATGEDRQAFVTGWTVAGHFMLKRAEHIAFGAVVFHLVTFAQRDLLAARLEAESRLAAEDRPASAFFSAFGALEEKRMPAVADL